MSDQTPASPAPAPGGSDQPPGATPQQDANDAAAAAAAAASAAIERGATVEETRKAVADAVGSLKLEISDADADKIADRMIGKLESRGAFEEGATAPPPPAGTPAAAGTDPNAIADAAAAGVPNDGRDQHGGGVADPPPRRASWAERFQGKS